MAYRLRIQTSSDSMTQHGTATTTITSQPHLEHQVGAPGLTAHCCPGALHNDVPMRLSGSQAAEPLEKEEESDYSTDDECEMDVFSWAHIDYDDTLLSPVGGGDLTWTLMGDRQRTVLPKHSTSPTEIFGGKGQLKAHQKASTSPPGSPRISHAEFEQARMQIAHHQMFLTAGFLY